MIFSTSFRKTVFISLLGHIALFSIFSFSFGHKIASREFSGVSFWGAILRNSDLTGYFGANERLINSQNFTKRPPVASLDKTNRLDFSMPGYYLKPAVTLKVSENKAAFAREMISAPFPISKKGPVIMFYPQLPYHFLVYFKDRQIAHIELMFNIISSDKTDSIAIKRKISSGNLEADLLVMRYINHYLFIQQASFPPHSWQTVKIDLSAKDGK